MIDGSLGKGTHTHPHTHGIACTFFQVRSVHSLYCESMEVLLCMHVCIYELRDLGKTLMALHIYLYCVTILAGAIIN